MKRLSSLEHGSSELCSQCSMHAKQEHISLSKCFDRPTVDKLKARSQDESCLRWWNSLKKGKSPVLLLILGKLQLLCCCGLGFTSSSPVACKPAQLPLPLLYLTRHGVPSLNICLQPLSVLCQCLHPLISSACPEYVTLCIPMALQQRTRSMGSLKAQVCLPNQPRE